jgi:hypothetical protein
MRLPLGASSLSSNDASDSNSFSASNKFSIDAWNQKRSDALDLIKMQIIESSPKNKQSSQLQGKSLFQRRSFSLNIEGENSKQSSQDLDHSSQERDSRDIGTLGSS